MMLGHDIRHQEVPLAASWHIKGVKTLQVCPIAVGINNAYAGGHACADDMSGILLAANCHCYCVQGYEVCTAHAGVNAEHDAWA